MNSIDDINKQLDSLGLDDYGIKELKPLYKQVSHSLSQIIEADQIKAVFWGQLILSDANILGMIIALEDVLLIIGANPLEKSLFSIQFPFIEMKDIKEMRNKDTNVVMEWIFTVKDKTYNVKGLKGFVPSKVLSYIYEQIKKNSNQ